MTTNNLINGIYVELDSIIDTRLKLMYNINKDLAGDMVTSGDYYTRTTDSFRHISIETFKYLYSNRTADLLRDPIHTNVGGLVSEYCVEADSTGLSFGDSKAVDVYLNIYPYDLPLLEIETLRMGMSNSIKGLVNIEIINKSPAELTVEFMDENIGVAIMYNAIEWLEMKLSDSSILSRSLPDLIMMTPKLFMKRSPIDPKETDKMFRTLRETYAPLIDIHFMSVRLFCHEKKETEE